MSISQAPEIGETAAATAPPKEGGVGGTRAQARSIIPWIFVCSKSSYTCAATGSASPCACIIHLADVNWVP